MTAKILLIVILVLLALIGFRIFLLEKRVIEISNKVENVLWNQLQEPIQLPERAVEISPEIFAIVECESSWVETAVGDEGRAFGYAQFHKPTFEWLSKLAGQKLDYYNPNHQLWLLKWALENEKGYLWTCYLKLDYNN